MNQAICSCTVTFTIDIFKVPVSSSSFGFPQKAVGGDFSNVSHASTDYGHPLRKSPSLHGQKSNPNPKFLGTAKAYFVCHISPKFQISLICAFIGCPYSVVWIYIHILTFETLESCLLNRELFSAPNNTTTPRPSNETLFNTVNFFRIAMGTVGRQSKSHQL